MHQEKYILEKLQDTINLAHSLASNAKIGDIFFLEGDLGSGKTTFSKFFINYFYPNENVTSPTFNLVLTYDLPGNPPIWHFDLYRLKKPSELAELGLEEASVKAISLIEWPQLANEFGIVPNFHILFEVDNHDRRIAKVSKIS